jgi:hypothetical protein
MLWSADVTTANPENKNERHFLGGARAKNLCVSEQQQRLSLRSVVYSLMGMTTYL